MSLQLAPEVETAVRQYAKREGVSPEELLRRAFPPVAPVLSVQAWLHQWQQEYGLPPRSDGLRHTSARELFAVCHLLTTLLRRGRCGPAALGKLSRKASTGYPLMSYPFIILDAYPLGNVAVAPPRSGTAPASSEQCRQWMTDCEEAGSLILVPAMHLLRGSSRTGNAPGYPSACTAAKLLL